MPIYSVSGCKSFDNLMWCAADILVLLSSVQSCDDSCTLYPFFVMLSPNYAV